MTAPGSVDLIAVDLGNSRLKVARFDSKTATADRLPEPSATLAFRLGAPNPFDPLERWVTDAAHGRCRWVVASVHDAALANLTGWLGERGVCDMHRIDDPARLSLETALPEPGKAGIDRLLNAVAVNAVRPQGRAAIVVDAGSAVTVDAISSDGVFLGGAIFPGLGLEARALAEFTEKLPLLDFEKIDSGSLPALPATSTPAAMSAGLFWAMVGSVREVVAQTAAQLPDEPWVVLTGGGAEPLVPHLNPTALWQPHLTLQGIWHVAQAQNKPLSQN